jgi:DNA-binding transcriptional LysR family regulator
MDRGDLGNLTAFVAVADQRSFRAAASQLGVTPSALSHSMRLLEERLGVRLLHRATRSVSVTHSGLRALAEAFLRTGQLYSVQEDWSPSIEDRSSIIRAPASSGHLAPSKLRLTIKVWLFCFVGPTVG